MGGSTVTYVSAEIVASVSDSPEDVWVVYDQDCPFCSRYLLLYRLRQQGRRIHLINARSGHALVTIIDKHRFDLNEGMVVRWRGRFYYGAGAMHLLGVLGDDHSAFNRLNRAVFSNPSLARVLYPWFVLGRKLTLRVLGRKLITTSLHEANPVD
jgi:predicted DCC family thiol-disulfide oxidoreductase YuxK